MVLIGDMRIQFVLSSVVYNVRSAKAHELLMNA